MKNKNQQPAMFVIKQTKRKKNLSSPFSKTHLYKKTLAFLSICALIAGTYFCTYTAQGVDYTFTQTSWGGGSTSNIAIHASNQTGWNQYSAKDANISFINSGADATLTSSTGNTSIDFNTESQYIQQDAANGTDFTGTQVVLHGSGVAATGGTITYTDSNGLNPRTSPAYAGGYTVHTFTSSGTFTSSNSGNVAVLIVAGGGGGSSYQGGGGGAGGVIYNSSYAINNQSYAITVGGGGVVGANGQNSVFNTLTAIGGGRGGSYELTGGSGGSGGGQGAYNSSVGLGTAGQGNNGGSGGYSSYEGWLTTSGGGGGGAGAAGGTSIAPFSAGAGGAGVYYSISGISSAYGGGGGGTWYVDGGYGGGYAAGGVGGGGSGSTPGVANTGGGGSAASGGSGIVIVRYPSAFSYPTSQSYYITTNAASQKNTSTWGSITGVTTTQTTPTNTNIKYLVSFDNRSTWKYWNGSSWQSTTLTNIATTGMTKTTIEAIAQAQWKASGGFTSGTFDIAASLSSANATATPSLDNIQINYATSQTQTLTSNVYNTQNAESNIAKIQWTENLPANTNITFQLRTSPDGTNWTPWCGPDNSVQGFCNSSTYFTDPTGGETIDDIQRDRTNDQFVQYKAFLTSTDGISAPMLSDVSLNYATIILPAVTTQAVTDITSTGATGNANLTNAGGENSTRYIQWGTQSGNYTQSCSAGTGGIGTYPCSMTGLTPATTYYVRAYAANSAGTSYGSETSFTTAITTPTVTTQAVTDITTNSVIGSGNIVNVGGEDPQRFIEWGTQSGNYTQSCVAGIGGTGAYTCQITNLTTNTTYYARAKTTNSAGTSYGDEISFTTLDNIIIPDPDPTKMTSRTNEGYMVIRTGSVDSAIHATTNAQITFRASNADAIVPQDTTITKTGGGSFDLTQFVTANVTNNAHQQNYKTLSAVKAGIPTTGLTFSQLITITLTVDPIHEGKTLRVVYQNDGESTWYDLTTCTITDSKCTFQTDHFTTYAVVDGELTGATSNTLSATIAENLTLNCGTDVDLDSGSTLIPGTPQTNTTTCTVTTNDESGYDLQLTNDRGSNNTLYHTTQAATIDGQIQDKTKWNPSSPNATNFTGNGLAFGILASDATKNTTWWGDATTCSDTDQLYAGIPATDETIMQHTGYSNTPTDTTICYQVNVPSTQLSGEYEGSVTYTATGRP